MNYREKTAWLNLACMLVAYSLYFSLVIAGHPAGREMFPMLWLFGSIAATQAVIVIAGTVALLLATPKADRKPADERDRAIGRRGKTFWIELAGPGPTVYGHLGMTGWIREVGTDGGQDHRRLLDRGGLGAGAERRDPGLRRPGGDEGGGFGHAA